MNLIGFWFNTLSFIKMYSDSRFDADVNMFVLVVCGHLFWMKSDAWSLFYFLVSAQTINCR